MRDAKAINQLKEDKQAFGLLVAKEISPEEVNSYQQCQKAPFRNYLINESKSTRKEVPTDADGMVVVWAMPIKSTWKELADTFLEAVTPQEYLHSASTQIIMDTYDDNRIKEIHKGRGVF